MRHAAGRIPPPPVQAAALIIQVNITVILHILKSIAFVSGNVLRSTRSSREDRHVLLWSFFFFFPSSEALPTCVIVWPLSACLPQRARLCSSPRPPSLPLAHSTPPCGHLQTRFSPHSQEQLFQNWPTCIQFTTTAAPESVLNNLLRLFPARITLSRDGDV